MDEDSDVIRLHDFTPREAQLLNLAILKLAHIGDSIRLHELEFVTSSDCRLDLQVGSRDQGILQADDPSEFAAILTKDAWDDVAGLMQPFLCGSTGYQWLIDAPHGPALLLSPRGEW